MADILTVDLRGRVESTEGIEFLRAEMIGSEVTPFALVRYAVDGQEQRTGLRIDLDKAAFIDHPEDPRQEAVIQGAGPAIVDLLTPAVNFREIKIWSKDSPAEIDALKKNILFLSNLGNVSGLFTDGIGLSEFETPQPSNRTSSHVASDAQLRSRSGDLLFFVRHGPGTVARSIYFPVACLFAFLCLTPAGHFLARVLGLLTLAVGLTWAWLNLTQLAMMLY